jgi:hypothetical protein
MGKKIILLVFLLMIVPVSALGVSPGKTTIDFIPGLEKNISINLLNSEQKEVNLVVSAQGELKDYFFIPETTIHFNATEISKTFSYTVRLPQQLSPGSHTTSIVVVQLPDVFIQSGEMSVGAAVAVLSQLTVNAPYPGKYAEADVNIAGPKEDGIVKFYVPVFSKGTFTLTSVKAEVEIYTLANEKIATVYTNEVSIDGGSMKELSAEWDSSSIAPGPYRAKVTVFYDEGTVSAEKEFTVGKKRLIVEGVEVNDFSLGDIAKFEVAAQSTWSEMIKDAYVEMVVYSDDGNILANFKSPNYDIPPNEKVQMLAFWDTNGVIEGDYDTTMFLNYGSVKDPTTLTLRVEDNKITIIGAGYIISAGAVGGGISSTLLTTLIVVIVLLTLANISWFVYLRKKFTKSGNRR